MRKKGKDVCYRKTLNLPRGRREAKLESGQVGMDLAARGSGASADSSAEPEPGGWPGVMPRPLVWELAALAPPVPTAATHLRGPTSPASWGRVHL